MLKRRADGGKATLLGMNRIPAKDDGILGWLDIRVESRLSQIARVVVCSGPDLRKSATNRNGDER